MNKFLKYLIFIFIGILIYLILNQINQFTIGSPDSLQYPSGLRIHAGGGACAATSRVVSTTVQFKLFTVHLSNLFCNPSYCTLSAIGSIANQNTLRIEYKIKNYVIHDFLTGQKMFGGDNQAITEVGLLYVKDDVLEYTLAKEIVDTRDEGTSNFDINDWINRNTVFISFVDRGADFMSPPYRLDTREFVGLNNNSLFKIEGHVYKPFNFYKFMQYREIIITKKRGTQFSKNDLDTRFEEWSGYLKDICDNGRSPTTINMPYYRLVRKSIKTLFSDNQGNISSKNNSKSIFPFMGGPVAQVVGPGRPILDDLSWIPLHDGNNTQLCKITDPTSFVAVESPKLNLPVGDLYSSYADDESITSDDGGKTSKLKDSKFFTYLLNEEIDVYEGVNNMANSGIHYPHESRDPQNQFSPYLMTQNNLQRSRREDDQWNPLFSVDYTLIDLHGNTFTCCVFDNRSIFAYLDDDDFDVDGAITAQSQIYVEAEQQLVSANIGIPRAVGIRQFFPTIVTSGSANVDDFMLITYKTSGNISLVNYEFTLEYPLDVDMEYSEVIEDSEVIDDDIRIRLISYFDSMPPNIFTNTLTLKNTPILKNKIISILIGFVQFNNLQNQSPEEIFLKFLYYIHTNITDEQIEKIRDLIRLGVNPGLAPIYLTFFTSWDDDGQVDEARQKYFDDGGVAETLEDTDISQIQQDPFDVLDDTGGLSGDDKRLMVLKLLCLSYNVSTNTAISVLYQNEWDFDDALSMLRRSPYSRPEVLDITVCDDVIDVIRRVSLNALPISIPQARVVLTQNGGNVEGAAQAYIDDYASISEAAHVIPTGGAFEFNFDIRVPSTVYDFYQISIPVLEAYDINPDAALIPGGMAAGPQAVVYEIEPSGSTSFNIERIPSNLTVFRLSNPDQYNDHGYIENLNMLGAGEYNTDVSLKVICYYFNREIIVTPEIISAGEIRIQTASGVTVMNLPPGTERGAHINIENPIEFEVFIESGTILSIDSLRTLNCFAVDTQFIKEYFIRHNIGRLKI